MSATNLSVLQQNTLAGFTAPGSHTLYLEACDRVGELRAFAMGCEWEHRYGWRMAAMRRHAETFFPDCDLDDVTSDLADFVAIRFLNFLHPPKGNRAPT